MIDEIVKTVDEYLIGYRTLREIEAWLAARTRLIHQSGDQRAIELANHLEADLVDLSEELLDEKAIRDQWDAYLRQTSTVVLETAKPAMQTVTSTESTTFLSKYATPESDVTLTHQFAE